MSNRNTIGVMRSCISYDIQYHAQQKYYRGNQKPYCLSVQLLITPIAFLLVMVLSVVRFTASDYPYSIYVRHGIVCRKISASDYPYSISVGHGIVCRYSF
jgi:hypothetical protein